MMKTIICDIDGTIFKYSWPLAGLLEESPVELLPGVLETINRWESSGHKIILMTGRRESFRQITEDALVKHGIPFDMLIMGCADEGRVLVNDINFAGKVKAHAANLKRNAGMEDYDWSEVGL